MPALRRALVFFLLACVSLALGDGPYVDEFLDDLAAQSTQVQLAATSLQDRGTPAPAQTAPGSSKLCGSLLILSCAPDALALRRIEGDRRFVILPTASYSSAVLRRIDRPPARTARA